MGEDLGTNRPPPLPRYPEHQPRNAYQLDHPRNPMSILFEDRQYRTRYERCLLDQYTPQFTEKQIEQEKGTLELIATILCEGSASLSVLLTCLNHFNTDKKKDTMTAEEFESFMKSHSHFFTIYEGDQVQNTSYGMRRYFPSIVCFIASFQDGVNLRQIRNNLAGLPYKGDGLYSEYFWERLPDLAEMKRFFKKHPEIFTITELHKEKIGQPREISHDWIQLKPQTEKIPSLWDSRIFLSLCLPKEDKSLSSFFYAKVVACQKRFGAALIYDTSTPRIYFQLNSVGQDVKDISKEFPQFTSVVAEAHRLYDDGAKYKATKVIKAQERFEEAELVAEQEAKKLEGHDETEENNKLEMIRRLRRMKRRQKRLENAEPTEEKTDDDPK